MPYQWKMLLSSSDVLLLPSSNERRKNSADRSRLPVHDFSALSNMMMISTSASTATSSSYSSPAVIDDERILAAPSSSTSFNKSSGEMTPKNTVYQSGDTDRFVSVTTTPNASSSTFPVSAEEAHRSLIDSVDCDVTSALSDNDASETFVVTTTTTTPAVQRILNKNEALRCIINSDKCSRLVVRRYRQLSLLHSFWSAHRVVYGFALFFMFFMLSVSEANEKAKRCVSCSLHSFEEYKQIRQEQILNDLLKKLDLSSKPNVTVDYDNLPPIGRNNPSLQQLIEQSLKENHRRVRKSTRSALSNIVGMTDGTNVEVDGAYGSDESLEYFPELYETPSEAERQPEISYLVAAPPPEWFSQEGQVAFFQISPSLRNKVVRKASLIVYLKRPDENRFLGIPIRVDVYERFWNGTLGDKIATKYEHLHADMLQTQIQVPLDALEVQQWLHGGVDGRSTEPYVGLYVQAIHDNKNLVYYPGEGYRDDMFVELEITKGERSGRGRRSVAPNVCQAGSNETKCCLYDLMIDFEKVGWEFVIAPKRFNAYICNGECSTTQMSQTARGTIAQQANTDYYQCCHPKEYTGIRVVYVTESNQIWVKEVPAMIARKCGCA